MSRRLSLLSGTLAVLSTIAAVNLQGPLRGQTTLGTSASATNPQKSGDATTGLFSDTANTVEVAAAGIKVISIRNTGVLNIPVAPTLGGYQGSFQLNGSNAAWQDPVNYNLAIGPTTLPIQISHTGGDFAGQYLTGIGYQALNANTTGYANTALGHQALTANTTGSVID
jgi:hypothetical protein